VLEVYSVHKYTLNVYTYILGKRKHLKKLVFSHFESLVRIENAWDGHTVTVVHKVILCSNMNIQSPNLECNKDKSLRRVFLLTIHIHIY
jgi:hypothetical protein